MKYTKILKSKLEEAIEELKAAERALVVYNYLTKELDFRDYKAFEISTEEYKIDWLLDSNHLSEAEKEQLKKLLWRIL